MAKTLKDIVDELLQPTDVTSLKELKTKAETAKKEYEDTPAEPKDVKETKKAASDTAQQTYEKKRADFLGRIRNSINAEREKDNLAIYSAEVAERRKTRKISNIEDDILKCQGSIDICTLKITAVNTNMEEMRKGLPAKTA
jgi:hypothetical protein